MVRIARDGLFFLDELRKKFPCLDIFLERSSSNEATFSIQYPDFYESEDDSIFSISWISGKLFILHMIAGDRSALELFDFFSEKAEENRCRFIHSQEKKKIIGGERKKILIYIWAGPVFWINPDFFRRLWTMEDSAIS